MKIQVFLPLIASLLLSITAQAQTIEIEGKGVLDEPISTLHFEDHHHIDHVVVEAVYKKSHSPACSPVRFYDEDESYTVKNEAIECQLTDRPDNYDCCPCYFTATFNSIDHEGITLDQMENVGAIYSFIAYVYRNTGSLEHYSFANCSHALCYRNGESHAYNCHIPINAAEGNRNITVKLAISEMSFDERIAVIQLNDGHHTYDQIIERPNMGNALNIVQYELLDVPGYVSDITVSIYSPASSQGDSFIAGGIVLDVEQLAPPQMYCTKTQGFYGNPNGQFNQISTSELLDELLASDLVVGGPGHSLTLGQADVECLMARLPGGGKPDHLTADATCMNPEGILLHDDGRFKNSLLSQTITLGLNLRLDEKLGHLPLMEMDFLIHKHILEALGENGNVKDLYIMANTALADENTNGVNFCKIKTALTNINNFFNDCSYLPIFSGPNCPDCIDPESPEATGEDQSLTQTASIRIFPNPLQSTSQITFSPGEEAPVTIEILDMQGHFIKRVYQGTTPPNQNVTIPFNVTSISNGIYLLRMINGNQLLIEKINITK